MAERLSKFLQALRTTDATAKAHGERAKYHDADKGEHDHIDESDHFARVDLVKALGLPDSLLPLLGVSAFRHLIAASKPTRRIKSPYKPANKP